MGIELDGGFPTKRELGVGYLTGAGLALLVSLLGYLWFTRESFLVVFVGVTTALALFATIVYIGYLFLEIDFSEQFVWDVARGTALGLGVAVLLSFGIGVGWKYFPSATLVPSLLVITIATGGVVGTLLGVVMGLREQHRRMRTITQRNKVMNRVLRHNIKNSMHIIQGRASLLADDVDDQHSIEAIKETADEVVSLSDAARRVDSLTSDADSGPVDVVPLIEDHLETARKAYPEADITADLPATAWVDAGRIVRSAIVNVVENAVEHSDDDPDVRVSVRTHEGEVVVSVADNGPGIPDTQREVLFSDREGPTRHGNGLGLWLVKWIADHYGGELEFEGNEPRGTVVTLRLPAAEPPPARDPRGTPSRGA